jgi:hypothetical protein
MAIRTVDANTPTGVAINIPRRRKRSIPAANSSGQRR